MLKKILVRKPEGNTLLERYRYKWEHDFKMDLKENVHWILVLDREKWKAPVNMVMNFQIS